MGTRIIVTVLILSIDIHIRHGFHDVLWFSGLGGTACQLALCHSTAASRWVFRPSHSTIPSSCSASRNWSKNRWAVPFLSSPNPPPQFQAYLRLREILPSKTVCMYIIVTTFCYPYMVCFWNRYPWMVWFWNSLQIMKPQCVLHLRFCLFSIEVMLVFDIMDTVCDGVTWQTGDSWNMGSQVHYFRLSAFCHRNKTDLSAIFESEWDVDETDGHI